MTKQVDVVCIKHGTKIYDWSYVDKLFRGVSRSFSHNVNFTVFTDSIDPSVSYQQVQLPYLGNLEGWERGRGAWWFKMWLFSHQHPIQRQFVYFDLDTVFTGNCDFLLDVPEDKFAIIPESQYRYAPNVARKVYNSSVMVINPQHHNKFWKCYAANKERVEMSFHGDQTFISQVISERNMDIVELDRKKIVYWLWDIMNGGIKSSVPVSIQRSKKIREYGKLVSTIVYNTPGVHSLPEGVSIVIYNGAKTKPSVYSDTNIIKEFWV